MYRRMMIVFGVRGLQVRPYQGFSGYRIYGIFGGKINGTLDTTIGTDISQY